MLLLICSLGQAAIIEGSLDSRFANLPATLSEIQERKTLSVRLNYGLYECQLLWDLSFSCGDIPEGRYYIDVGSRFVHFEGAVVEVKENGQNNFTIFNPITHKYKPSRSRELTLSILGKAQIFEVEASTVEWMKGMIFSMPSLMLLMFGLMYFCKNVISEMDESQQPAREAAAQSAQVQQGQRKKVRQ